MHKMEVSKGSGVDEVIEFFLCFRIEGDPVVAREGQSKKYMIWGRK